MSGVRNELGNRFTSHHTTSRTFHTLYAYSFPVTGCDVSDDDISNMACNAHRKEARLPHKIHQHTAAMNLKNERANESGNRHQIQRSSHHPAGQVAVATLLGPLSPFRIHVSSHNRHDTAGHRNRLRW